jgi:hypothetical protein
MMHHLPLEVVQSTQRVEQLKQTAALNTAARGRGVRIAEPPFTVNHAGSPNPPLATHSNHTGDDCVLCINCGHLHARFDEQLRRFISTWEDCPFQWGEHCVELFTAQQVRAARKARKPAASNRPSVAALQEMMSLFPPGTLAAVIAADDRLNAVAATGNGPPSELGDIRAEFERINTKIQAEGRLSSKLVQLVRQRKSRESDNSSIDSQRKPVHTRPPPIPDVIRSSPSFGFTSSTGDARAPAPPDRKHRTSIGSQHFASMIRHADPDETFSMPRHAESRISKLPTQSGRPQHQSKRVHVSGTNALGNRPNILEFADECTENLLDDSPQRTHITTQPGSSVAGRMKSRHPTTS